MEANVKSKLLERIQTGNPIRDTVIAFCILSSQETVTNYLAIIRDFVFRRIKCVLIIVVDLLRRKYYGEKVKKTMQVKYITDKKEQNTLFDAVFWYSNTLIDPKAENNINIQTTKDDDQVAITVPMQKTALIKFEKYEIEYEMRSDIITIHAEREHKRENPIIALNVLADANDQEILRRFVDTCKSEYDKKQTKKGWKPCTYRNEKGKWISTPLNTKRLRNIKTVILKEGQIEAFEEDLDGFLESEEWYTEKSIPYTRGYLFYGHTGAGKSSLIKSLMGRTKRSVHYLVLSGVKSDEELFTLLKDIKYDQTVLVLEDIDCMTDIVLDRERRRKAEASSEKQGESSEKGKEKEKKEESTLKLSGLLNALDGGMIDAHGRIMVMTTNHIHKLDSALIRTGRVDLRLEFGVCDEYQIVNLFKNYFDVLPPSEIDVRREISPADVAGVFLTNKKNPDAAWGALKAICE